MGNGIRFQERRLHLARTQQVEMSARRIGLARTSSGVLLLVLWVVLKLNLGKSRARKSVQSLSHVSL